MKINNDCLFAVMLSLYAMKPSFGKNIQLESLMQHKLLSKFTKEEVMDTTKYLVENKYINARYVEDDSREIQTYFYFEILPEGQKYIKIYQDMLKDD